MPSNLPQPIPPPSGRPDFIGPFRASWLRNLLFLIIPLSIYAAILLIQNPFPFRQISIAVRYSFLTTLFAAGLILVVLFNLRGWIGSLASLSAVLALFSLGLLGLWVSGESNSAVISGLLPLYDQSNYYLDAQRLLAGGGFSQFSSWRPMFPGLLALLLAVTGNNLQIALAILGILPAAACFLFAREVQRSYGPLAAVTSLLILFFYYRQRVSGMVMSEQPGLAFGALGLALILRGACLRQRGLVVLGIFMLGLGLNARPGAFFILPALVLWAARVFRSSRHIDWRVLMMTSLAVAASFLFNSLVKQMVAAEPSMLFSNFSYALYGLVNGGTHFSSVEIDHPEVLTLSGNERYWRIYALVLETFLRNPLGIVRGAWSEWSLFFSNTGYSVFSYMAAESPLVTLAARLSLYAFSLVGLVRAFLQRRDPHFSLVLAGVAGVILSVPFVPPGDAFGVRLYAATMPVIALLPALGISFLLEKLSARVSWLWYQPAEQSRSLIHNPTAYVSILLALIVFLAPGLVKLFWSQPVPKPVQICPAGLDTLYVRLHPGSFINVYPESAFFSDRLPNFHLGRFARQVHGLPDTALANILDSVDTPITFYRVIDVTTFRTALLSINPDMLPARQGLFMMCGSWDDRPRANLYNLFWPEQIVLLSQPVPDPAQTQ